jgi:hypothetical protein
MFFAKSATAVLCLFASTRLVRRFVIPLPGWAARRRDLPTEVAAVPFPIPCSTGHELGVVVCAIASERSCAQSWSTKWRCATAPKLIYMCVARFTNTRFSFYSLHKYLIFTRSSIRARLINRGQQKERGNDGEDNCASGGRLYLRGVAQLTSPVRGCRMPSPRV